MRATVSIWKRGAHAIETGNEGGWLWAGEEAASVKCVQGRGLAPVLGALLSHPPPTCTLCWLNRRERHPGLGLVMPTAGCELPKKSNTLLEVYCVCLNCDVFNVVFTGQQSENIGHLTGKPTQFLFSYYPSTTFCQRDAQWWMLHFTHSPSTCVLYLYST